ncbi:MAG TPA: response regulator transcription factor [Bosea sp. (in: a-proteobacteria)]
MRESRAFGIVIVGKYSLMKEGVYRVLQGQRFRAITSVSCVEQLGGRLRAQKNLFLIVYCNDDFDFVVSEIGLARAQYPDAHIAVVADHNGLTEPAAAFKAGATGYLVNAHSCDAFVKSIELVMLGETFFPPAFPSLAPAPKKLRRAKSAAIPSEDIKAPASSPPDNAAVSLLSPREAGILCCLVDGDSNKCIARKIGIAEATVKAHVKAILRKIRVQNRTQAAIWGMNNAVLLRPANNNSRGLAELPDKVPQEATVGIYQL